MIRISPIRVIDADGTQLGVITRDEALEKARSSGLDLVEVNPVLDEHNRTATLGTELVLSALGKRII